MPGRPPTAAQVAQLRQRERSALVSRTKNRYEAVQALKADGKGIKTIMRELDLAKETVRRFFRAENIEELLAKPRAGRPSLLDAYKPYLHERCNAGITTASMLYREIHRAGLPRQPGHRRRLPRAVSCARCRTTGHTGGAQGPPDHLLDAAPTR